MEIYSPMRLEITGLDHVTSGRSIYQPEVHGGTGTKQVKPTSEGHMNWSLRKGRQAQGIKAEEMGHIFKVTMARVVSYHLPG